MGGALQHRVDGRLHLQAAAAQRLGAVLLEQLVAHVLDEVGLAHPGEVLRRPEAEPERVGVLVLGERDVALVEHRRQHLVAALLGRRRMQARVVERRRLRQAGDQRGLADVELRAVLVEVRLGRRLAAVGDAAVGDHVQVGAEDLVLRPVLGHLDRQPRLLDLALDRLRVGQVQVPDELLLDRRCALDDVAGLEVVQEGAHDALVVDAAVLVEALVLDVHRRDLEPLRDLRERHRGAVLERRDLGEHLAVPVVDLRRHARVVRLHRRSGRRPSARSRRPPSHRRRRRRSPRCLRPRRSTSAVATSERRPRRRSSARRLRRRAATCPSTSSYWLRGGWPGPFTASSPRPRRRRRCPPRAGG